MVLDLRRSPRAKADLIDIWRYIARDNDAAADRLSDRPEAGRPRPELHADLRSFPVGNYIIFYTFDGTALTVVRVLSGFRDISEDFLR
ncbi:MULTISPECIES: type II toxin-antitoxin system RelE/ParE family toxin [unclassified Rhizobium]|uniref:type II toxin-antitoxin system RelE/ParE family toxin n=1 Tax=unclassified Rhizobium TaxID=2613769 RepID=UPI000712F30F|nr:MULTISPECIES: type II toxin-antitoxin system RelE/ParE family toxin [unclassified Rhizobium]KQS99189.1 plasmid stabilization protein [Rhizobium sp. Leaf386]KQT05337.1 plasmid stabilization protein [Rhizobium sp. Leaf391]KQT91779.1 plasmid stabilization protein [Rhizobium sp. Leaf453]